VELEHLEEEDLGAWVVHWLLGADHDWA
jgi:hypothetical protein